MKLNRWLWAGGLFVLSYSAAAWLPSKEPGLTPQPDTPSQTNQGQPQPASVCQAARPAVVTLYANTEFGSGSIVRSDGLVLTNYHVVKAAAAGLVRARGWSGSLFKGRVVATDAVNDLALVQLDTKEPLPEIRLATTAIAPSGQAVCAIGSPFGRTGIITLGTLKGLIENGDLQSSIFLHPGNSGGPLLNRQGEMIGVNKAIWLSETGENIGLGFATTATIAQTFIQQNRQKATVLSQPSAVPNQDVAPQAPMDSGFETPTEPPSLVDLPPDGAAKLSAALRLGALINEQSLVIQLVEPGSPAENAGLTAGDRVVAVDRQPLYRLDDLQTILKRHPQSAMFTISRNQQQQDIRVSF